MADKKVKGKASKPVMVEPKIVVEAQALVETAELAPEVAENLSLEETVEESAIEGVVEEPKVSEMTAPAPVPKVVMKEEVTQKEKPRQLVKIRVAVNHTCHIGGENYHFEKGKQYNVSESVKRILTKANLLLPL